MRTMEQWPTWILPNFKFNASITSMWSIQFRINFKLALDFKWVKKLTVGWPMSITFNSPIPSGHIGRQDSSVGHIRLYYAKAMRLGTDSSFTNLQRLWCKDRWSGPSGLEPPHQTWPPQVVEPASGDLELQSMGQLASCCPVNIKTRKKYHCK